ncbi:MAG: DUF763 domain-containing protein [bacterium]|nr:DUF763 domain-containing protein [Patescibacteria group bacterium]MDW8279873.1 DUF763 domain-containing protein [bacterium]
MNRGIATFTLDEGKCPKWLFERMVELGREIIYILIQELGPDEFIKRISHPVWFQSLGTVLAFDWNASGLTTVLTAALKEAIRGQEKKLGIFICGGKGKTSRKTPEEIKFWGEKLSLPGGVVSNLEYNSRMAAKVDSALIQDGFQIYHHSFFFSKSGSWAVVQQGMNTNLGIARRYHWYSNNIRDLICEPHSGIISEIINKNVLNLTASQSELNRRISLELVTNSNREIFRDLQILNKHFSKISQSFILKNQQGELFSWLNLENVEFKFHPVVLENFFESKYLKKILQKLISEKPQNYEKLLAIEGVGPKTIRALSLVSEIIYGAKPSYKDPARYSFAFGGKDGTPYPVDKKTYDETIILFKKVVAQSKIDIFEKRKILKKLN